MSEIEEGMDFEKEFLGQFGNRERTRQRLKAERVAGMTHKQRVSRKIPKTQINFRATATTKTSIDALAARLNMSQTDVIELAIAELAKSRLG
jgi:hypothetical protein